MRKFVTVILAVFMIAALVGCAQKQAGAPPEQPGDKPGDAAQAQPGTPATPEEIAAAVKEIDTKIGDVFFAYDKYDLDDKAKTTIKGLAALLNKKNVKVVIEGNCDERGTKEYNLALGDKRASAAKQYLISLGIPSARIGSISYGKEKPVCTEATEACWAKNRRDHFVVPEAGQ